MKEKFFTIYNGAEFCPPFPGCPIVQLSEDRKMIRILDPQKPESGEFQMTAREYDLLLTHAKPI